MKFCDAQGKHRPCNHDAAFLVTSSQRAIEKRREVCGQHLPSAVREVIRQTGDHVIVKTNSGSWEATRARILGGAS